MSAVSAVSAPPSVACCIAVPSACGLCMAVGTILRLRECLVGLMANRKIVQLRFGYGSIPINTIFRGMNIHLPAILMFTRGIGF